MKTTSMDELKDQVIGKIGTKRRDKYEDKLTKDLAKDRAKQLNKN